MEDECANLLYTYDVLRFGSFTLKSKRNSPYFFNMGNLHSGEQFCKLGKFYATKIHESQLKFDVIFGAAYKGIPLATATIVALATLFNINTSMVYNRKEVKHHGEGGQLIGAVDKLNDPKGCRVLLIDDVLTAGTAVKEVLNLLKDFPNAKVVGLVIALDREEKCHLSENESASKKLQQEFNFPVLSILKLTDIINFVKNNSVNQLTPLHSNNELLDVLEQYRKTYGASME